MTSLVEPIIEVGRVTKEFGGRRILKNVSFDVLQGEIMGIIGGSGAGKTTLLKILIGFLDNDGGTVSYRFKNKLLPLEVLKREKALFYKFLGFSAQDCSFYPQLTVYDNVALYGVLNGLRSDGLTKKVHGILRLVNLPSKKSEMAANLSLGMQKQLDIACSLVHEPKIIFLDEPAAHLDGENRKVIWKLVERINSTGVTVVIATHFLNELKKICDRIYLLKNKKMILQNA